MALSREEIEDIARGKAREVLERHGIPEVIDNKVMRTVVETGLLNCGCSREAVRFSYELATIQHGNLMFGISDEHKVAKAIEFFGNNVDERSYGAYLKSGGCEIRLPYGASHKRLQDLYKEDWTKANDLLGEITSAIDSGAANRGGGACEALELLYKALAQSNPGGQHVTIEEPGKTTFKPGEIISKETFDKENERVRKLGEKPATGTPSVKG